MSKVIMGSDGFYGCLSKPQGVSTWWKETAHAYVSNLSGADPGFFLGGGAPLRNGVTKADKPHFFCFAAELDSRRSSQGEVRTPCTLPLDPS